MNQDVDPAGIMSLTEHDLAVKKEKTVGRVLLECQLGRTGAICAACGIGVLGPNPRLVQKCEGCGAKVVEVLWVYGKLAKVRVERKGGTT